MKKISYILIAILALISGACGGDGDNGWTDSQKALASASLERVGYDGKDLDCAERYVQRMGYNEFKAEFNTPNSGIISALVKACGHPWFN